MLLWNKKLSFVTMLLFWFAVHNAKAQTAADSLPKAKWKNDGLGIEYAMGSGNNPMHTKKAKNYEDFSNYIQNPSLMPSAVYPELKVSNKNYYGRNSIGVKVFLENNIALNYKRQASFGISYLRHYSSAYISAKDTLPFIDNGRQIRLHYYEAVSSLIKVEAGLNYYYKKLKWIEPYIGINYCVGQSRNNRVFVHFDSQTRDANDSLLFGWGTGSNTYINGMPFLYSTIGIPYGIRFNFGRHFSISLQNAFDFGIQYIYGRKLFYMPMRWYPLIIGVRIKFSKN